MKYWKATLKLKEYVYEVTFEAEIRQSFSLKLSLYIHGFQFMFGIFNKNISTRLNFMKWDQLGVYKYTHTHACVMHLYVHVYTCMYKCHLCWEGEI